MRRAAWRSAADWVLLLAGPTIWFAHFGLVYAAASLELTLRPAAGPASRLVILAATIVALALCAFVAARANADSPRAPGTGLHLFWCRSTRLLCLISGTAIVFQALPAALVP